MATGCEPVGWADGAGGRHGWLALLLVAGLSWVGVGCTHAMAEGEEAAVAAPAGATCTLQVIGAG